ncbi:hypothetical protein ACQPW1_11155 [Nocardia sp. CA-128927]|uniref:hypothetical protein n=1 Tax=Nocardia sp. CA-128927 TaxID=3239975 RepID=UPI003D955CD6
MRPRTTTGDNLAVGSDQQLLTAIAELSDGRGVALFLDNLGGTLFPTALRALARQGIISTTDFATNFPNWSMSSSEN